MNEEIVQIAQRIRALRDINGISMESLSAYLGMNITDYQKLESGKTDISVALIIKISQKLNVEFAALLTGENPRLHQYCVVRKGHGAHVERMKQYTYESLAYNFIHKKAEPFLVDVTPMPKEVKPDFNAHPGQEFNYILEGDMEIYFEDHVIELHEGDSIYFDSSHKHAMKALHNKSARFLAIIV
jgi:transcriptional regulator with XRE-family HTH domain